MILNSPTISGSLTVTGNIITSGSITISGSIASASYASNAELLDGLDSTVFTLTSSLNAQTASFTAFTASLNAFSASINTATSSFSGRVGALESYTASLNLKTASFATTGSNNFTSTQHIADTTNPTGFDTTASLYSEGGLGIKKDAYISSSLYIKGNLTVYGTQSVSYITSSQLNISTNLITVNTATPSVRFGGIAVQDSGSVSGLTGSLLWDSQNNSWLYNNPSGSGNYDSSLVIMGPRNSSALGSEVGLNCNYLIQGHGHHHTTSSAIFHDGTNTCFPGSATTTDLRYTGNGYITYDTSVSGTSCLIFRQNGTEKMRISECGYVAVTGNEALSCVPYLQGMSFGWNRTNGQGESMINWTNAGGGSACDLVFNFKDSSTLYERVRITSTGISCFSGTVCAANLISTGQICSVGDNKNLDIGGVAVFRGNGSAYQTHYFTTGAANVASYYQYNASGTNTVKIAAGEHSYFNSGCNFGIGTATPGVPLDIQATGVVVKMKSTTGTNSTYINYENTAGNFYVGRDSSTAGSFGGSAYAATLYSSGNYPMEFWTNGVRRLNIDGGGNVGLCTTSPATRLGLNSYVGARLPYINGTNNTYDANGITVGNSNNGNTNIGGGIDFTNNCYCIGAYSPILSFSSVSSNYAYNNSYAGIWGVFQGAGGDANWNKGDLVLGTAAAYGMYERMRITSTGYVGINITSACKHLEVGGTIRTTAAPSSYYRDTNYVGDTFNFGASEATDNVDFKICGGSTWSSGGNFRWWTQAGNATPIERMRITSAGIACFACQVCAPSGVKFGSGTTTLNYYEEGSWTPTFSNSSTTPSYIYQFGRYTRIGRVVHVVGKIGASNLGSGTVYIGGLPFSSQDASDSGQRVSPKAEGDWSGFGSTTLLTSTMFRASGTTFIGVRDNGSGQSIYADHSTFSSTLYFNFHATYYV